MNRLLVKLSKRVESPFETNNDSFASPSFAGPYRSPTGDQSVTSYASSVASEAIHKEFLSGNSNVKKEFIKSLITDP